MPSLVAETATYFIFKIVTFIGGVNLGCRLIKSNLSCEMALTQSNVVLLAPCVQGYSQALGLNAKDCFHASTGAGDTSTLCSMARLLGGGQSPVRGWL